MAIDRATAFVSLTKLVQGLLGLWMLAAASRVLTPVEQGVFFTILAMTQIQAAAEMGLTTVLVQVASHLSLGKCATAASTRTMGVHERALLGSLISRALAWMSAASVAFLAILLPVGYWFFAQKGVGASDHAAWSFAAITAAANLLTVPLLAIREGGGGVASAWRTRLAQQLASGIAAPLALELHAGCWSIGIAGAAGLLATIAGLALDEPVLRALWADRRADTRLSWRREVWPFQWKVSLSYLSGIFIVQLVMPAVFRICGPIEAGRFGLTYNALRAASALALSVVSAKAQAFGAHVAAARRSELDRQFDRACLVSLALATLGLVVIGTGLPELGLIIRSWNGRALALVPSAILTIGMLLQHSVQCMAIYLRAHREEPLLVPSLLGAAALGLGFPFVAEIWGVLGVCYWFLVVTLVLGQCVTVVLFHRRRHRPAVSADGS